MSDFVIKLILSVTVFMIVMSLVPIAILMERRLSAFIQDRLGPNRVGFQGILQPIADGLKLIMKEEVNPPLGDKVLFMLAPAIILVPAFMLAAVIPIGDKIVIAGQEIVLQATRLDFGILYIFAIASMGLYGLVLGAWSSNNKYALLGGIRASAQMVSYELALGLSVVPLLLMSSSLQLNDIVLMQQTMIFGFIPSWNVLIQPISFFIFITSAFAETNRLPFDLAECEQELVSGYHAEYSGMKFALFLFSEYANMIVSSMLIATLFFGGWHIPFIEHLGLPDMAVQLLQVGAFLGKTVFFIVVFIWVRWTLPRFKYDKLMDIGWKVFLPLAILNILVTGIIIALMN